LRHEQAAAEAARHAAGESLTELVAEARRKVAEARAARAAAAAAAEKLRKEQQRLRKVEEALRGAMARMAEARAGSVEAVEEAMQAAAKHGDRSESLAALVAEAKGMVEQARAAAAEAAAERLRLEAEAAALALRMQNDALRMQQVQAQLGVPPAAPAPQAEETLCVLCFDAPKDHIILPCGHQCVCKGCAEQLTRTRTPTCPLCRRAIRETTRVFS
jgi:hypothetical protein